MEYFISAFIGLLTGYAGFLLGRRQDNLMLKKNIYLEYIANCDKHFRVDNALFSKTKFISDFKLSNLLDWHKLLSDYKNFLEQKILMNVGNDNEKVYPELLRQVIFVLRDIEQESKVQMLEEIRIYSYKFGGSTYKYIKERVENLRASIEENSFTKST